MSDLEERVARAICCQSRCENKDEKFLVCHAQGFRDSALAAIAACGVEELRAEVERLREALMWCRTRYNLLLDADAVAFVDVALGRGRDNPAEP